MASEHNDKYVAAAMLLGDEWEYSSLVHCFCLRKAAYGGVEPWLDADTMVELTTQEKFKRLMPDHVGPHPE